MPAHDHAIAPPNHWLLILLRRVLAAPKKFARKVYNIICFILALLRGKYLKGGPGKKLGNRPTVYNSNGTGSLQQDGTICASMEPQALQLESLGQRPSQLNLTIPDHFNANIPSNIPQGSPSHSIRDLLPLPYGERTNGSRSRLSTHGTTGGGLGSTTSLVSMSPSFHSGRNSPRPTSVHSIQIAPVPPWRTRRGSPLPGPYSRPHSRLTSTSAQYSRPATWANAPAIPQPSSRPISSMASGYSSDSVNSVQIVPASPAGSRTSGSERQTVDHHAPVINQSSPSVAAPVADAAFPPEYEKRTLFAVSPAWSERYGRIRQVESVDPQYTVQPMKLNFDRTDVPKGWTTHVHPEGTLYFYHQDKKVITEAYICEEECFQDINVFFQQVQDKVQEKGVAIPSDAQLVLELMPADTVNEILCGYYFVNHETRCLFWLEPFDAKFLFAEISGEITDSHFKNEMEAQYWIHREYFPALVEICKKDFDDFRSALTYAIGDTLVSKSTTSPFTCGDLQVMWSLLGQINDMVNEPVKDAAVENWLARTMATFANSRFLNFYGQRNARLDWAYSLHEKQKKSTVIRILSPLLFSAPDVHIKTLNKLYTDRMVTFPSWQSFMEKLNKEWQEFLLLGEVLLTVNVSFLAIPSVDTTNPGESVNPNRSLAQLSSYVSIIATVGSIVIGLLLVRQSYTKTRENAGDAGRFLSLMFTTPLGLDKLAIIYSLPYALLMWGMVAFVVSFCAMCFQGTSIASRLVVGISGLAVVGLIFWCIYISWESREQDGMTWWLEQLHSLVNGLQVVKEFWSSTRNKASKFLVRYPSPDLPEQPSGSTSNTAV